MQSCRCARQCLRIFHDLNTPSRRYLRTRGAPTPRTRGPASRYSNAYQDVDPPRRRSSYREDDLEPPRRSRREDSEPPRRPCREDAPSRADEFLRTLDVQARSWPSESRPPRQPKPQPSTSKHAASTPPSSPPSSSCDDLPQHHLTYPPPQTSYTSYVHSPTPNTLQLHYSTRFFTSQPPQFLHSSAQFRTLPRSSVPEVAFLGRSNVGKSSLLNALVERSGVKIAHVSAKPGRTRTMNAFGVGGVRKVGGRKVVEAAEPKAGVVKRKDGRGGRELEEDGEEEAARREEEEHEYRAGKLGRRIRPEEERERDFERWVGRGGLVVLDMPGYGKASRDEWGKEILKYLGRRKQLRRIFLLIDSTHGLKATDLSILRLLSSHSLPHQLILTKLDRLLLPSSKTSNNSFLANIATKFPALCDQIREELRQKVYTDNKGREIQAGTRVSGDILGVSEVNVPKGERGKKMGIECLRWEVLCATGLECDSEGRPRVVEIMEETGEEEE